MELQSGASGERLGWVELDFGCSTILLGQQVATEAAHQPENSPNPSQPNPSPRGDAPPCRAWLHFSEGQ